MIFIGIFQDEAHPNPNEAYALIKLYVSYFALNEEGLPKKLSRFEYIQWFISKRLDPSLQEVLSKVDKSSMTFE